MKNDLVQFMLALIVCIGCATTKTPVATGGSKADGTVEMSYSYSESENTSVDWETARNDAAARCARWGYKDAELFGGSILLCQLSNQHGCIQWVVTTEFQCVSD